MKKETHYRIEKRKGSFYVEKLVEVEVKTSQGFFKPKLISRTKEWKTVTIYGSVYNPPRYISAVPYPPSAVFDTFDEAKKFLLDLTSENEVVYELTVT